MNLFLFFLFFSGSFSGTGEAHFKSGRKYLCQEIFLRLETTQTMFRLREGGYSCGDLLKASFDPFKMMVQNGQLFHENQVLGSISQEKLSYEIYDPEDGSTYSLKLIRTQDGMNYHEEWHDGETVALKIQGNLKKH